VSYGLFLCHTIGLITQSHSCPYSFFILPFNTPDDKKYTPNYFSRQAKIKGGSFAMLGCNKYTLLLPKVAYKVFSF